MTKIIKSDDLHGKPGVLKHLIMSLYITHMHWIWLDTLYTTCTAYTHIHTQAESRTPRPSPPLPGSRFLLGSQSPPESLCPPGSRFLPPPLSPLLSSPPLPGFPGIPLFRFVPAHKEVKKWQECLIAHLVHIIRKEGGICPTNTG